MVELRQYHARNNRSQFESWFDRIDFGPGYRVYFGWDGVELVILLGGGTKKRQSADIKKAQGCWSDYKTRTKEARKKAAQKCH